MVEIDGEVIRLAKQYMPEHRRRCAWHRRARRDHRGRRHRLRAARRPTASFDAIIVDSTDPIGVGEVLFTDAVLFANCARILSDRGVIVNQCGVPFMQADELRETSAAAGAVLSACNGAYVAAVPTYVGGFMTLGFASKAPGLEGLAVDEIRARAARAGILGGTRYWTPEIHAGAFNLPPYIAEHLPRT